MTPTGLHTPKDVQDATGASASALRNYTRDYARYLSTEATETPRKFTDADMKVIAYIIHCTKDKAMTHDQVLASLAEGALDSFAWVAPQTAQVPQSDQAALVPIAQLQALNLLLQEAQQQRSETYDQVQALQEENKRLSLELGRAQGSLDAYKAARRRPTWWVWLFGGE